MNGSALWLNSIGNDSGDVIKAVDVNGDRKCDLVLFSRRIGKVYTALLECGRLQFGSGLA